jgi:hypothetical protein
MGIRRKKTILEQAGDYVEAAVEKAGPILAEARDQAGPAVAEARDRAQPLIEQGAALVAEKAAQGKELVSQKAGELTAKPKKKHRLRKLLIITGVAALLGFVAKRLTSRNDEDNWQSSYAPPPTDDRGAAGPDEALADATEEAHEVTSPDEPADVVDVSPGEEPVTKENKP